MKYSQIIVMPIAVLMAVAVTCVLPSEQSGLAAAPQTETNHPRVPATIKGYESADLYAKVAGYVKSVAVDIGIKVEKGQVLAVIDVPEMDSQLVQKQSMLRLAQAQAKQAVARIEEAQAGQRSLNAEVTEAKAMYAQKQALCDYERSELQRVERLAASGAIHSELLDSARFKLKAAESELMLTEAKVATAKANLAGGQAAVRRAEADSNAAQAQIDIATANMETLKRTMEYATIRAPWAGKIAARMIDAGAFVQNAEGNSSAKPLFKLIRDDRVRVVFSLSQKNLKGLEIGTPVSLSDIDALPGKTFSGTVSRFSAELDVRTRMLRVEMDLDNADGKLKSGFFGYATVELK